MATAVCKPLGNGSVAVRVSVVRYSASWFLGRPMEKRTHAETHHSQLLRRALKAEETARFLKRENVKLWAQIQHMRDHEKKMAGR